jgi:hypothetical protein
MYLRNTIQSGAPIFYSVTREGELQEIRVCFTSFAMAAQGVGKPIQINPKWQEDECSGCYMVVATEKEPCWLKVSEIT